MADKLNIYVFGDYQPHSADGLLEFSSQNANLLRDEFNYHFIRFDKEIEKGKYSQNHVDGFIVHVFGSKNVSSLLLPKAFRDWLKNLGTRNTVFHLNHIYTYNNYVVAKALVKKGIPYLITPHDSYVYREDFRNTRPFLKRIYRDFLVRLTDRYVLNHAKLIHELTDKNLSALRSLSSTIVQVVPNQIRDTGIKFDLSKIKQQICFIGRFDIFQKGIDRSLQGFSFFKKHYQGSIGNIQFILIGPASRDAELKRLALCDAEGLEVGKDVVFPGKVEESERDEILSQSRVYLQMSRYEGFGLSILQALSTSTPVIISKQIPIGDKILEYNAGFVTETKEETAIALNAIFSMSQEEYLMYCRNARRCYEEQFHSEIIKEHLIKMYRQTAGQ